MARNSLQLSLFMVLTVSGCPVTTEAILQDSLDFGQLPPNCISYRDAEDVAAEITSIPSKKLGILDISFVGFSRMTYWVVGSLTDGKDVTVVVDARSGRVSSLKQYNESTPSGSVVKPRVARGMARETALAYATRHFHRHSLSGMRLVRDGESLEPDISFVPGSYRFTWTIAEKSDLRLPRYYCSVYVSPVSGEVLGFEQNTDDDGLEPNIDATPKLSKKEALEKAKQMYEIVNLILERTSLNLHVWQDEVGEKYLVWDIRIKGTNPAYHWPDRPPTDKNYLWSLGNSITIDALTGEVLQAQNLPRSPGYFFWPEHRGIDVDYFGHRMKLYQPPVRKDGKLYLNRGFFPPFLINVDEDLKHGAVRLRSAKGERNLAIGKQALLINGRLLLPADLLVELSPETVTIADKIAEGNPNYVNITWDYEHRRTPYPEPKP